MAFGNERFDLHAVGVPRDMAGRRSGASGQTDESLHLNWSVELTPMLASNNLHLLVDPTIAWIR